MTAMVQRGSPVRRRPQSIAGVEDKGNGCGEGEGQQDVANEKQKYEQDRDAGGKRPTSDLGPHLACAARRKTLAAFRPPALIEIFGHRHVPLYSLALRMLIARCPHRVSSSLRDIQM